MKQQRSGRDPEIFYTSHKSVSKNESHNVATINGGQCGVGQLTVYGPGVSIIDLKRDRVISACQSAPIWGLDESRLCIRVQVADDAEGRDNAAYSQI